MYQVLGKATLLALAFAWVLDGPLIRNVCGQGWARHTIDRSSRGADGVRLLDFDGDGRQDVVTGWEEGGQVRLYLQPASTAADPSVRDPWPAVTVGRVKSPEDAVGVDLDGDGQTDVVTCCEGKTKTVFVHWAPSKSTDRLRENAWSTTPLACTASAQSWMFAVALPVDGKHGPDLIVGAKGKGGSIGWLEAPDDPRDAAAWQFHRLYSAGWIMSLVAIDLDGDQDLDILASDRKGKQSGVLWIENPGTALAAGDWPVHRIGGDGLEVMFLTAADLNQDQLVDVVCTTRNGKILLFRRLPPAAIQRGATVDFEPYSIPTPDGIPTGKAVTAGDINGDGRIDIVHSTNTGGNRKYPGVTWMECRDDQPFTSPWRAHNISGSQGIKFDRMELLDIDQDGDLDVITCEERDNLGVFWYENPGGFQER